MPVLDWARTDLFHNNPNGATNLYFNYAEFAYFDIYILKREGARQEWARFKFPEGWGEGRDVLAECDALAKTMTPEKDHKLVENIVIKTQGFVSGNFSEASHLGGRADLIELCRIFEKENPQLPMRVDHGMTFTDEPGGILDESSHGHNAGYTLLGRMFALGQVQGILATVDRELGIEYKQPGFYD